MAPKKQPPDLVLGRRWPHRLLQLLPPSWKLRYLLRQSGGTKDGEGFELASRLQEGKRLLIVWPERAEELLMAFPAMRVLHTATGDDSVYAHLVPAGLKAMIADLFPGEQLLAWSREELAWHDPAIQVAIASLRAFSPEIAVNLMGFCPSVVKALVRVSGARLRMAVDEENSWPYVNVRLQADPESSLAARYFQILNPWRYAGFTVQERWPKLQPDAGQRRETTEIWSVSGLTPENTWLYLHDSAMASRLLDDELHAWILERIHPWESEKVVLAIAILNSSGESIVEEGKWQGVPVLKASSLSEFINLAGIARGVASFPGPGLYVASLTDVRCLAFLKREEAACDISQWNSLFKVDWL